MDFIFCCEHFYRLREHWTVADAAMNLQFNFSSWFGFSHEWSDHQSVTLRRFDCCRMPWRNILFLGRGECSIVATKKNAIKKKKFVRNKRKCRRTLMWNGCHVRIRTLSSVFIASPNGTRHLLLSQRHFRTKWLNGCELLFSTHYFRKLSSHCRRTETRSQQATANRKSYATTIINRSSKHTFYDFQTETNFFCRLFFSFFFLLLTESLSILLLVLLFINAYAVCTSRHAHTFFFFVYADDATISWVLKLKVSLYSRAITFHVSFVRSSVIIIANLPTCVLNLNRKTVEDVRAVAINRKMKTKTKL